MEDMLTQAEIDALLGGLEVDDRELEITAEFGKTEKTVEEIFEIEAGAIIELDKPANESVNIFANGKIAAKGEIVKIESNFGVKITEML